MVTVGRRQPVWKPRPRKTRFSKRGQIGCVLKENALQKWEVIIEMAEPVHSSLLQLLAECKTEQEVRDMIENAFRGNWGTCNKRAGSFAMFVRWCRTTQIKQFPLTIHKVYKYVEMLRQENAPATRAHSFLSAGRYATIHLGLISGLAIFDDQVVQGATKASYDRKRLTRQAAVFHKEAVALYEHIVVHSKSVKDRVLAGHIRFAIGARLRGADSINITHEPTLDLNPATGIGYVEAKTFGTKTLQGYRKGRVIQEAPCHSWGIEEENWGAAWLKARKDMKLDAAKDGMLLPTVTADGSFDNHFAMRTEELAVHIRELLITWGYDPKKAAMYTSHSLKATCLSWCAKAGIDMDIRRILGYHVVPGDKTMAVYSRDVLALPLRHLGLVLRIVLLKEFDPDTTRSGRWLTAGGEESIFGLLRNRMSEFQRIDSSEASAPPPAGSFIKLLAAPETGATSTDEPAVLKAKPKTQPMKKIYRREEEIVPAPVTPPTPPGARGCF